MNGFDTDIENKVPGQLLASELESNKIQDGGGRHIENHIFSHNSANIKCICTEFETQAENGGPADRTCVSSAGDKDQMSWYCWCITGVRMHWPRKCTCMPGTQENASQENDSYPSTISVPNLEKQYANANRPCMPYHAGCDTTSALYKVGKRTAYSVLAKNVEALQKLETFRKTSCNLISALCVASRGRPNKRSTSAHTLYF